MIEKDKLIIMKKKMEDIADILYKGNTEQGIAAIKDILPYLSMLATDMENEELQGQFIEEVLSPLLQAMEDKDGTMMADIITFELIHMVEKMG